jgi:tetratricopeptide (TPR) repeat protein
VDRRVARLVQRARHLEQGGQLDEALTTFTAARELAPQEAAAHAAVARLHRLREEWSRSETAYQAAVDRDVTRAEWHFWLGYVRQRQRDWAGAGVAYRDAVLREPTYPNGYYRLGYVLERAGDWPNATLAFRRADAIAREHPGQGFWTTAKLPYQRRVNLSLLRRPAYAYAIHRACTLAQRLGVERITVIELGVAGGNGLLAMEEHAIELAELTGVEVDVVGFDTGGGLFAPQDVRDMPYFFKAGNYRMDVEALQARLRHARLILGDAAETFPAFLDEGPAPIGAISFDMDVYSATAAVLGHIGEGTPEHRFLPRSTVYFDDVSGWQGQDYNRYTGELLAIEEFNEGNGCVKLAEDRTFRTLPVNHAWHHGVFTLHRFEHPDYASYVSPADEGSLRLRDR